jgi:alginate O-acetyltransferase complex protein AlgJ
VTIGTKAQPPARAESPASQRPGRRLTRRPVALALALVFFFGPLGALMLGARPHEIENRRLTEFPSLSDGWSFFPQFTTWATDHLPLRGEAVRGNAALSEALFHEPPSYRGETGGSGPAAGVPADGEGDQGGVEAEDYPGVIAGDEGWLYYGQDVANLCRPTRAVSEVMERLDRLAAAVEASGRRFVLVVAPDKSSVYPGALPDTYVGEDCAQEVRDEFWDAIDETPPPGYIDLRARLRAEQERTGQPLYRRTDTHWVPRAAALYALALADRLDPALGAGTDLVETGPAEQLGDLGVLIGQPKEDEIEQVELRRPGVTPVGRDSLDLPEMPYGAETFTSETTSAPLFQPDTLLLGDSFTSASRTMLGQFFAKITLLHNEVAGPSPQAVADLMAANDVVILEVVERTIASGRGPIVDDAALTAIERTLAAAPR